MLCPQSAERNGQRKSATIRDVRLDWLLADVEKKADRCLAENPQADHAQDLARAALELVRTLREGEQPYRQPASPTATDETSSLVALERALEDCQQKLARAEQELAARRR